MSPAVNDTDTYTIICLIAKETVSRKWVLNQNNTYYVNCLENDLSDDFGLKLMIISSQQLDYFRTYIRW